MFRNNKRINYQLLILTVFSLMFRVTFKEWSESYINVSRTLINGRLRRSFVRTGARPTSRGRIDLFSSTAIFAKSLETPRSRTGIDLHPSWGISDYQRWLLGRRDGMVMSGPRLVHGDCWPRFDHKYWARSIRFEATRRWQLPLPSSIPLRTRIRMRGHVAAIHPSRTLGDRRCHVDNAQPLFAAVLVLHAATAGTLLNLYHRAGETKIFLVTSENNYI